MESIGAILQYLVHGGKNETKKILVLFSIGANCRAVYHYLDNYKICRAFWPLWRMAPCTHCIRSIYLFPLFGFFKQ